MDKYNFDTVVRRIGRGQLKWEPSILKKRFGRDDLLSFWIADMDFKTPPVVVEALVEAAKHGVIGYTDINDDMIDAYLYWQKRRNGWNAMKEWFRFSPGVVSAINMLIQSVTNEGDEILIQRPVYYPFTATIETQRRVVVSNSLVFKGGRAEINFEDFEKKASSSRCKAFLMSNPHNPVGRVFTEKELCKMGEICSKNGLFVIADEIHSDLIFNGYKHTVFAKISEEFALNCAVCHAPSKTFNLPGLALSCIMIPDEKIRERYDEVFQRYCRAHPNYFAPVAAKAAWQHGEDWLKHCMIYIHENYLFVKHFVEKTWGDVVTVYPLEGTYLLWIDFNHLESEPHQLEKLMHEQARVALDEGYIFGPEGKGFERINLAAPRSMIQELMERIAVAFANRK